MKNVTRHQWISVAAYYKAETRNFAPGKELDDWLAAENDYMKMQIAHFLAVAEEDDAMTVSGLQQLAKSVGVENPEKLSLKIELIQSIQNAVHDRPCFRANPVIVCEEEGCQWKGECKKMIAEWHCY